MVPGRLDDRQDLFRGDERPHPVVHQDDLQIVFIFQGLEGVVDAVLAFLAPGHQAQHLLEAVRGEDLFLAEVQLLGVHHQGDLLDLLDLLKDRQGMGQDGFARQRQVRLGEAVAHAERRCRRRPRWRRS